jgi:hypothetical protein
MHVNGLLEHVLRKKAGEIKLAAQQFFGRTKEGRLPLRVVVVTSVYEGSYVLTRLRYDLRVNRFPRVLHSFEICRALATKDRRKSTSKPYSWSINGEQD